MIEIKFIYILPIIVFLINLLVKQKKGWLSFKVWHLAMALLVPAWLIYLYIHKVYVNEYMWVFSFLYMFLSLIIYFEKVKTNVPGWINVLLYLCSILIYTCQDTRLIITATVASSFLLVIMIVSSMTIKEGLITYISQGLSDLCLIMCFILQSDLDYSIYSSIFLILCILIRVINVPYLHYFQYNVKHSTFVQILYYPLTNILLASFLLQKFYSTTLLASSIMITLAVVSVPLLIFLLISLISDDMKKGYAILSVLVTTIAFMGELIDTGSSKYIHMGTLTPSIVFAFLLLRKDMSGLNNPLSFSKCKNVIYDRPFSVFCFFIISVFSIGFWGTLPYLSNMTLFNLMVQMLNISQFYYIVILLLFLILFMLTMLITRYIYAFITNVSSMNRKNLYNFKRSFLGMPWVYVVPVIAIMSLLIYENITHGFIKLDGVSTSLKVTVVSVNLFAIVSAIYVYRYLWQHISKKLTKAKNIFHKTLAHFETIDVGLFMKGAFYAFNRTFLKFNKAITTNYLSKPIIAIKSIKTSYLNNEDGQVFMFCILLIIFIIGAFV